MTAKLHKIRKPPIKPPTIAPTDVVRELLEVVAALAAVGETILGTAVGEIFVGVDGALVIEVKVDVGMLVESDGTGVVARAIA